ALPEPVSIEPPVAELLLHPRGAPEGGFPHGHAITPAAPGAQTCWNCVFRFRITRIVSAISSNSSMSRSRSRSMSYSAAPEQFFTFTRTSAELKYDTTQSRSPSPSRSPRSVATALEPPPSTCAAPSAPRPLPSITEPFPLNPLAQERSSFLSFV